MTKSILCLLPLAFSACFTTYASRSELPTTLASELDRVEQYYLTQAAKNAAFVARCAEEDVKATILTTQKARVYLSARDRAFVNDAMIATIGVDACDQRLVYVVVCGYSERYAAPVWSSGRGTPCKVIAEGSGAQQAISTAKEEEEEAVRQQVINMQQNR
jgi:hypothetical protein